MQIHQLQAKKKKRRKTVGRGGKRGTYSGRGNKGQKARSGAKINPLFEGGRSTLIDHLKKVRGFKSTHPKKANLNLNDLERNFANGATVSMINLLANGLLDKIEAKKGVKILSDGKLSKNLIIGKGILLSRSAKNAIEKSGGKILS